MLNPCMNLWLKQFHLEPYTEVPSDSIPQPQKARGHPRVTPVTLQAPDTAASAPALQTFPSARSFIPTVQIYWINYIMVVQHPGKGDAVNNVSPVDNSISVSMDLWRKSFHGAHPLQACKSLLGKVSKGEDSVLLTHTLARGKGTFRGTCQHKEAGLIFLRAG